MSTSFTLKATAILGVSFVVGILGGSIMTSRTILKVKGAGKNIEVKGYAEKKIRSDLSKWIVGVQSRADTVATAYPKLESNEKKLLKFLNDKGISADKIIVGGVNVEQQFRYVQGSSLPAGYILTRNFTISSNDVDQITKIARETDQLIKEGIDLRSQPLQYYFTKLDELKIEMIGLAAQDSRNRAERLAANTKSKVGPLQRAEQGVFQITAPDSVDVSGYGAYDTSTIDKSIKSIVTMVYGVE